MNSSSSRNQAMGKAGRAKKKTNDLIRRPIKNYKEKYCTALVEISDI